MKKDKKILLYIVIAIVVLVLIIIILQNIGDGNTRSKDKTTEFIIKQNQESRININNDFEIIVPAGATSQDYTCNVIENSKTDLPEFIGYSQCGKIYEVKHEGIILEKEAEVRIKLDSIYYEGKYSIAKYSNNSWQLLESIYDNGYLIAKTGSFSHFLIVENDNWKPSKPAVLFVHGLAGSHTTWDEFINSLPESEYVYMGNYIVNELSDGYNVDKGLFYENKKQEAITKYPLFTMDFSDNQNISFKEQGVRLRAVINKISSEFQGRDVVLFTHSMGGLSARRCIMYSNENIAGLVTVATPHAGSFLGYLYDVDNYSQYTLVTSYLFELIEKSMEDLDLDASSNAVKYLQPDSEEMMELYNQNFPKDMPLVIVLSDWEPETMIKKKIFSIAASICNRVFNDSNVNSPLDDYSNSELEDHNDGVVSVASQQIQIAVKNGNELSPKIFYSDKFHIDVPKDIPCMKNALDAVLKMIETPNENIISPDQIVMDYYNWELDNPSLHSINIDWETGNVYNIDKSIENLSNTGFFSNYFLKNKKDHYLGWEKTIKSNPWMYSDADFNVSTEVFCTNGGYMALIVGDPIINGNEAIVVVKQCWETDDFPGEEFKILKKCNCTHYGGNIIYKLSKYKNEWLIDSYEYKSQDEDYKNALQELVKDLDAELEEKENETSNTYTIKCDGSKYMVMPKDLEGVYKLVEAKSACSNLTYNGYSDWFLPSKKVLDVIKNNSNIGGFDKINYYWSSTGVNAFEAAYMGFCDERDVPFEDSRYHIRCVRSL